MLILRLFPPCAGHSFEDTVLSWCESQLDEQKATLGPIHSARLGDLTADVFTHADVSDVCLWWPTGLSTSVYPDVLPAQQKHLLAQPVYEIEPYLAQDIDQVHVTSTAIGTDRLQLVGVDKAKLGAVINTLQTCGIEPHQIGLDAWVLDQSDDTNTQVLTVLCENGTTLLYWPQRMAIGIDTALAPVIVQQILATNDQGEWPAFQCVCANDSTNAVAALAKPVNDAGADWEEEHMPATDQQWWWRQAALCTKPTLSLRQGDFQLQTLWSHVKRWRPVWAAALLGVVLLTGLQSGLAIQIDRNTNELRAEQATLYRSYYPDANQIFDPPAQLRSRLAKPAGNSSEVDGLLTYAAFTDQFTSISPNDRGLLKRVSFSAKRRELTVQLSLTTVEVLERLNQALNDNGVIARIESARESDSGIVAQIALQLVQRS